MLPAAGIGHGLQHLRQWDDIMVGVQLARGSVHALLGQELAIVVPVVACPAADGDGRFPAHTIVLALPTAGRAAEPQGQWVALFGDELRIIR